MAIVQGIRAAFNSVLAVIVGAFSVADWLIFLSAAGACAALLIWVVNVGIGFFPSFSQIFPALEEPDAASIYDFCSYVFNFDFLKTYVSSYFFILVGLASVSISISVGFVMVSIVPVIAENMSRWFSRITGA